MSYEIDKRFLDLFVRDLPLNRRQQLSSYLNVEQILMSDCGFARDYRGIAQQINLSYSEIAQLEKLCDPFGALLNYEQLAKLTVFDLFELLVLIERYDILDDMIPLILDDLSNKINKNNHDDQSFKKIIPIQQNESTIWYDAYICYADSDLHFVKRLTEYLESPSIGFRLFVRDRDLIIGNWVYETFARLIETQCRRMIIILSPDFFQSHDCKFQSMFAAGLAIEKCQRIIIPIIYKRCETIPSLLRLMSKIDMSNMNNQNSIPDWSLKRLIMSIKPEQQQKQSNNIPLIESNDNDNNLSTNNNNNNTQNIQKNETIKSVILNNEKNSSTLSSSSSSSSSISTIPLISNISNNINNNNNENTNRTKINWIKTIKKKVKI